jgi:hypothetical protein
MTGVEFGAARASSQLAGDPIFGVRLESSVTNLRVEEGAPSPRRPKNFSPRGAR